MSAARRIGVALGAALLLSACGSPKPDEADVRQPLPTPQRSSSTAVAGTVALLRDKLGQRGFQLAPPLVSYRPSEPVALTQTPRTVLQVVGSDPEQGYVVVYELTSDAAATAAGTELARYLASGFGQTNFPLDAQFYVAQVGETLVFTWYSSERADDPAAARSANDAIQMVGQPFPVIK
jgi:hypothetical protein